MRSDTKDTRDMNMQQIPPTSPPLVCSVVYDQLCTFEYGITTELFALSRPEFPKDLYRFKSVCVEDGPVCAAGGMNFMPDAGLEMLAKAALIIIPGWRGIDAPVPSALIDALIAAHKRGARILTICSGVFVLAATGLLAGKSATTHWRYADALAARFPAIQVLPNVLYVDEGQVLTSAGSAAGIDLCLHVIRQQYGQSVANKMARSLILPAHREGGQAQYVPKSSAQNMGGTFHDILAKFRADLHADWSVQTMAEIANLSPRTLLRRFSAHTGQSPINWLRRERLAEARDMLETTDLNIDQIAYNSGFATPENFRLQFKNQYQISPSQYRNQFHG